VKYLVLKGAAPALLGVMSQEVVVIEAAEKSQSFAFGISAGL
jgi:hypothetical protein